jgi:hypothetical protein
MFRKARCLRIDPHQLHLQLCALGSTDRRNDRSVDLPLSEELPMTSSSVTASSVTGSTTNGPSLPPSSAEPRHEKDVSADCGPMSQQDISDAHGHDMHPQELVRLVGCHESDAEAARRAARDRK